MTAIPFSVQCNSSDNGELCIDTWAKLWYCTDKRIDEITDKILDKIGTDVYSLNAASIEYTIAAADKDLIRIQIRINTAPGAVTIKKGLKASDTQLKHSVRSTRRAMLEEARTKRHARYQPEMAETADDEGSAYEDWSLYFPNDDTGMWTSEEMESDSPREEVQETRVVANYPSVTEEDQTSINALFAEAGRDFAFFGGEM